MSDTDLVKLTLLSADCSSHYHQTRWVNTNFIIKNKNTDTIKNEYILLVIQPYWKTHIMLILFSNIEYRKINDTVDFKYFT